MEEKTEARLAMEKEAAELKIKGNIAGFKDETLAKKIADEKEPAPEQDTVCVGENACKGKFGIAGRTFEPGEKIILTKAEMGNRNISMRVNHGKNIGMIK